MRQRSAEAVAMNGRVKGYCTIAKQYEAKRDYIDINRLIYSKDDLFTTILPIRDGISVSLRL